MSRVKIFAKWQQIYFAHVAKQSRGDEEREATVHWRLAAAVQAESSVLLAAKADELVQAVSSAQCQSQRRLVASSPSVRLLFTLTCFQIRVDSVCAPLRPL